jgi:hypothetical protein
MRGIACCYLLLLAVHYAGAQNDQPVTLILWMDKPTHHYSFTPAPLRYDKDLAFSFTLDDGLISAIRVVLPYFAGGRVSPPYIDEWGYDQGGDGHVHRGLYYTDGCGHRRPFRAAVAINGRNVAAEGRDHAGYLSWRQVDSLSKRGWDIYDHGYAHLTGAGINAAAEIRSNGQAVEEHMGIQMTQFVVPGGKDDSLSQEPYAAAAFAAGRLAVHSGHYAMDWGLPEDGAAARHIRAGRWLLSSQQGNWKRAFYKSVDHLLRTKEKVWINAFTHAAGNDDVWGISLRFPDLRTFFDGLALRYGGKGKDNMWMASFQEVQDYQIIRHTLKYALSVEGRRLYCRFDPHGVQTGLKHKACSFIWKSAQPIRAVKCMGCRVESYTEAQPGKKVQRQVININW